MSWKDLKGEPLTIEMIEQAAENLVNAPHIIQPIVVSPRAYNMAKRIIEIKPNVILDCESTIWFYAHELGLKDEN